MKPHRRTLVFTVLVISLIVGLQSFNKVDKKDENQVTEISKEHESKTNTRRFIQKQHDFAASIIPLYKSGNLITHSRPQKKTLTKKTNAKKAKKSKLENSPIGNRTTKKSENLPGNRPVLDVSYSNIGFQRYVELIERKGKLFLLINKDGKLTIGPAITLNENKILRLNNDTSRLAVSRPHMISDNMIKEKLANIDIPENALSESVVLIFHKPFDAVLWDTIEDALDRVKISMEEVSQVSGEYVYEKNRIMLKLRNAKLKTNGNLIPLKTAMMVSI